MIENVDLEKKKVKTNKEFSFYSGRLAWRFRLDGIACIILIVIFCLTVATISNAEIMDVVVSQQVTNYKTAGQDVLIISAVIMAFVLLLLILAMCFHSRFAASEDNELLYILGINMAEEIEEEPLPNKPMDKTRGSGPPTGPGRTTRIKKLEESQA